MLEAFLFIILLLTITLPVSYLIGKYISIHFDNEKNKRLSKIELFFEKIEQPIFKVCNIDPDKQMSGKEYFLSLFLSNMVISGIAFLCLYFQNVLPFKGNVNYQLELPLILHILSSLITNTCQTHHIPELHLTHLSNYFIMPLLMFYSSASGIATGLAAMRGAVLSKLGNAYADVIKSMTRILMPFSLITSIIFAGLGMPNTFKPSIEYTSLENVKQKIITGPIAAFEAIKLFGENGLSCFNSNSAHPFENPTYLTNFLELVCILIVPIALIFTLGFWLKNLKQSIIILCVLISVLVFEFTTVSYFELKGNPFINKITEQSSPNWIGKETRLGIVGSSIFGAAVSNVSGSSNSSLDSFYPLVNLFGLFNLSNQSIFGVQGFGLVFTINFILYTAFFIGLMLGKTPELFGKKIEKNEIILSSILLLLNPALVFIGIITTLILYPDNSNNFYNHVHYFTRIFYEFASGAASNGSGLEGLSDNNTYWNLSLAIVMFIARYGAMAAMIFLGYSFANKSSLPLTVITFRTDTILFGFIFLFMSFISTILIYIPFLALGPLIEILMYR